MNAARAIVCGLLVTLLSLSLEAKPLTPAEQQALRNLLGDELSEYLASEERDRERERERTLEHLRSRLLRDVRLQPRAKAAWSRAQSDQPAVRKQKTGTKKGGSPSRNGCFGHKMDRIGTLSGMGC
ncbi:C-type natriuretic peptide [Arapaima gigas]